MDVQTLCQTIEYIPTELAGTQLLSETSCDCDRLKMPLSIWLSSETSGVFIASVSVDSIYWKLVAEQAK